MATHSAKSIVTRGDVVSCYFPTTEDPDAPGPSARPCLVVSTFLDRSTMTWKAIVAYGTSRDTGANAGFEIRIRRPDGLQAAGLHTPSRFVLTRMRILPVDTRYFSFGKFDSPRLGRLDAGLLDRLNGLREKISESIPALRDADPDADADEPQAVMNRDAIIRLDEAMRQILTGRRDIARHGARHDARHGARHDDERRPSGPWRGADLRSA